MYISCGGDDGDGTGVESEMGYVPNNPLFGMPLDSPQDCPPTCTGCPSCQGGSILPLHGLHGSDFDCGNCLDHNGVLSQSNLSGGYWTADDMNSFSGLSPLDIDPLPSLFPFSPCGASYKTERPTHDMADVLLSLKHVVHKSSPEPSPLPHHHHHHHHHGQQHQQQQQQHHHHSAQHLQQSHHQSNQQPTHHMHFQQQQQPHQQQHHQQSLHPNATATGTATSNYGGLSHPQASLTYTVHPHQNAHHHHSSSVAAAAAAAAAASSLVPSTVALAQQQQHHQQLHQQQHPNQHQMQSSNSLGYGHTNAASAGGYYDTASIYAPPHSPAPAIGSTHLPPPPPPTMYPSMSVNVSMNMTMHGYGAPDANMPLQCSQLQWTPQSAAPNGMNALYPPLLSPTSHHHYPGGATYSFTADFRPPTGTNSATNAVAAVAANGSNGGGLMLDSIKMPSAGGIDTNCIADDGAGDSPQHSSGSYYHHHNHHMLHHHHPHYHGHQQQQHQNGGGAAGGDLLGDYSPVHSPTYVQIRDSKSYDPLDLELDGDEDEDDDDEGNGSNEDGDLQSDSKPNLCRLCGKTYARPSTLKTHLRTHSGERPYRCPDCNKSFSQAANLTAHVRTHTGQKPFRCPICDRRFSQSSSVTTHMRTHSGERPYRCRSCKKAFSDSSTLTKHLRIHSGEKPYQCKLCLLRFSQSGNLNRHMRVHGTNGNIIT